MTFKNAIQNQTTTTLNGMIAYKSSRNPNVDLFFKIGASRHKDIIPDFVAAYVDQPDWALRIAAWARDIRQGAGERQLFRDILNYLEVNHPEDALKLLAMIPELGRYDDLLVVQTPMAKELAFGLIKKALDQKNGLAAKWMPRKGDTAKELRHYLGMDPKSYRQLLVSLTDVVETPMSANQWESIEFSKVPSIAHARYKKAFNRNSDSYAKYVEALVRGDEGVKVNAGAAFPYDILKGRMSAHVEYDKTELDLLEAQWNALPNVVGSANVLPLVDVSGSMWTRISESLGAIDVAVSLGLYFADKNQGAFKDCFLTFSGKPELLVLKGTINEKIDQMVKSNWDMNTDLNAAFKLILKTAIEGKVKQQDMPKTLIIFSDMQFDGCVGNTATGMIEDEYRQAGYDLPQVIFWNLVAYSNMPVRFNKEGVALVSGFSPMIAQVILTSDLESLSPIGIMLKTIMVDRYDPATYQKQEPIRISE